MRMLLRASVSLLVLLTVAARVRADTTPQTQPFVQSWTTTTLITADNVWTGVPGIAGYNGAGMGTSGTADPQTLLGEGTQVLQVYANHANPDTFASGGVTEFDGIANPVIALQGSGTAGAPNVVFTITTVGRASVVVAYSLRDIDASTDDAIQRVALQYRVGTTGMFTNLAAGYVADATTVGAATQVSPVSVTLPAACENQPIVQVRVITANAAGADEWVGIDDISITSMPAACGNGTPDTGEACDTGASNGTTTCGCQTNCQFASATTTCAAAGSGACDVPDLCDGGGACVPRVAASGTSCRASGGGCDPAEICDGVSTACPGDVIRPSGTECRAATGVCDVHEVCDGTAPGCPTDVFAANGTACNDTMVCNGTEMCMGGACVHSGAVDCADTNACTVDACVEATPMCTHTLTAAPACCNASADCDDGDLCTTDACTGPGGVCTFDPVPNCCASTPDCNDLDPCTTDTCNTTTHQCSNTGSCADAGADAGSAPADAGTNDAGTDGGGAADTGTSADATVAPDAAGGRARSAGCACRAGASGSSSGVLVLAGLGLAWLARRRAGRVSSR